jgi:peptidoglycan/LPS O-acetylase OafA/YrhL
MSTITTSELSAERRLLQLDGLRGIAVLLVMYYHFFALLSPSPGLINSVLFNGAEIGWAGVDLFFVLSGFLISTILLASKNKANYYKSFYARRSLRILPLYYANLILFFVVVPLLLSDIPHELSLMQDNQIWFWTFTYNWLVALEGGFTATPAGYFWSLSVEEQFYLLWPLVVMHSSAATLKRICIAGILVCCIVRVIIVSLGYSGTVAYVTPFSHSDGLLFGALIACIVQNREVSQKTLYWFRGAGIGSLVGVLLIWSTLEGFHFSHPIVAAFGFVMLSGGFGWLLLEALTTKDKSLWHRVLSTSTLRMFGKYSFALYLVHVPVSHLLLKVINRLDGTPRMQWTPVESIAFFIAALLASLLVAYFSWHLMEKHFMRMKRHFPAAK